jgi:alkylated DNA repair dioxygenase AlkB
MQLGFNFETSRNEFTDIGKSKPIIPIMGLKYVEDFISDTEHKEIWEAINKETWLDDLKRRVQHYGYKYDYKRRSLDYSMYIGDIPQWTKFIAERIVSKGFMKYLPDQLIVNEYKSGQGIADHIDCEPCFEDTIISLSLGSPCIMDFKNKGDKKDKHELLLEPKSLVVITGDARYNWTHGIASREKDKYLGNTIFRKTRISLTFRKVILNAK